MEYIGEERKFIAYLWQNMAYGVGVEEKEMKIHSTGTAVESWKQNQIMCDPDKLTVEKAG